MLASMGRAGAKTITKTFEARPERGRGQLISLRAKHILSNSPVWSCWAGGWAREWSYLQGCLRSPPERKMNTVELAVFNTDSAFPTTSWGKQTNTPTPLEE